MHFHLKTPLFLANWKMNFTSREVHLFFEKFLDESTFMHERTHANSCVGFAVPFPFLALAASFLEQTPFLCGAQNVHWEPHGAFTGEVSVPMLLDSGAQFVILGHSERRTHFGETNDTVAKRTSSAISGNLLAVVCVGETKEEFESGAREKVLRTQIPESLSLLSGTDFTKLVIAYEPVWAIGTGLSATPDDAESAHVLIREILDEAVLKKSHSVISSKEIPVIYGGSVKEANAQELISCGNIDGFLVGGASLQPDSFKNITAVRK
jgi:triosephosphate isomerase (TIM)